MILSFEHLTIIGLIGFYLYDSAILAFSNEIVFFEAQGHWSVSFPTDRLRVMRKNLFVPNPFTPNHVMLTVPWSAADSYYDRESNKIFELISAIKYLRLAVVPLMFLLIFLLPLVIVKFGIGATALVALVSVYLLLIAMLFYTYTKREKLGLSKRQVLSITFETLSCPPFAINLIRKISIKQSITSCPIDFAFKVLKPQDFKIFAEEFEKKLSDKIEVTIDDQTCIQIKDYRKKLLSLTK